MATRRYTGAARAGGLSVPRIFAFCYKRRRNEPPGTRGFRRPHGCRAQRNGIVTHDRPRARTRAGCARGAGRSVRRPPSEESMRDNLRHVLRSRGFGILAAVTFVGLTALARWSLTDVLRERAVYLMFLPAVALSAYLGGLWPGLVATLLGALCARLLIPGDASPLPTRPGELLQLSLFLVTGSFISLLTEHLRRA